MRILDLFCGAGGASTGYQRAGFEVVGVDLAPMPRYPFEFRQDDALNALDTLILGGGVEGYFIRDFDAIHASPPCQGYSATRNMTKGAAEKYPKLIGPVRELLERIYVEYGLPYVIENVEGAPLLDPVTLCGSMFGLTAEWKGEPVYLKRHRLFELMGFKAEEPECAHVGKAVTVAGHGRMGGHGEFFAGRGYSALTREVMDIDWMRRDELCEAIPPVYTEYLGLHLRYALLDAA